MGVNGIYGLSGSGLDVESMVKVGMLSKQNEYDKMQQKYTSNEWKKSQYLNVYSEIQTFNSSTLSQYKLSSNMNARSASSTDSNSVSATANASAAIMAHYVNVESLASNVYLIGTDMERKNSDKNIKNQIQSLLFEGKLTKDGTNVKYTDSSRIQHTYAADDTAIYFSINDGVHKLLQSTNSEVVTATATPVASTETTSDEHTLNITKMAQAASETTVAFANDGDLSDILKDWSGGNILTADIVDTYFENLATDTTHSDTVALSFTIGDGKTSKEINLTYSDLGIINSANASDKGKTSDLVDLINSKIGTDVKVEASISSEKLTFVNTSSEVGLNSKVIISFDQEKLDNAVTALNNYNNETVNADLSTLLDGVTSSAVVSSNTPLVAAYNTAYAYYEEQQRAATSETAHANALTVAYIELTAIATAASDTSIDDYIRAARSSGYGTYASSYASAAAVGGGSQPDIAIVSDPDIDPTAADSAHTAASNAALAAAYTKYQTDKAIDSVLTEAYNVYKAAIDSGVDPDSDTAYSDTAYTNASNTAYANSQTSAEGGKSDPEKAAIAAAYSAINNDATDTTSATTQAKIAAYTSYTEGTTDGAQLAADAVYRTVVEGGGTADTNTYNNALTDAYNASFTASTDAQGVAYSKYKSYKDAGKDDEDALSETTKDALDTAYTEATSAATAGSEQAEAYTAYKGVMDTNTTATAASVASEAAYNAAFTKINNDNKAGNGVYDIYQQTINTDGKDSDDAYAAATSNAFTVTESGLVSLTGDSSTAYSTYKNNINSDGTNADAAYATASDTIYSGVLDSAISDAVTTKADGISDNDIKAAYNAITSVATAYDDAYANASQTYLGNVTYNAGSAEAAAFNAIKASGDANDSDSSAYNAAYNAVSETKITEAINSAAATKGWTYNPQKAAYEAYVAAIASNPNDLNAALTAARQAYVSSGGEDSTAADEFANSVASAYGEAVNSGKSSASTTATAAVSTAATAYSDALSSATTAANTAKTAYLDATATGVTNATTIAKAAADAAQDTYNDVKTAAEGMANTAATAYSNALSSATTAAKNAATAYSNAKSTAETAANTAATTYSNAKGNADTAQSNYTNATTAAEAAVTSATNAKTSAASAASSAVTAASNDYTSAKTAAKDAADKAEADYAKADEYATTAARKAAEDYNATRSTDEEDLHANSNSGSIASPARAFSLLSVSPLSLGSVSSSPKYDAIAATLLTNLFNTASEAVTNGSKTVSTDTTDGISTITFGGDTVKGTIYAENGTQELVIDNLSRDQFFGDGNSFTYQGINYTVKNTTTGTKITNTGDSSIKITYGELADGFTLNELASKINGKNENVRATYDTVQDRFSIYNKESGEAALLNIGIAANNDDGNENTATAAEIVGTNTANLFNAFKLQQSSNGELEGEVIEFEAGEETRLAGENGRVKIDGVEYSIDSNKTTVNGVNYNFTNKTDGQNVVVGVTQDTTAIVEKVKSFVSDYNALLTQLYKWYDEKPNSEYKPLTAAQKEGMKTEQIEKWEEKAKAGLLYHDQTLSKVISDIRSAVTSKVDGIEGSYNNIFAVGISTTGLKGQLVLDEDKLNAALAADPDAVYNIFAKLDGGETQYQVKELSTNKIFWTTNASLGADYEYLTEDGKRKTKTVERSSYNGVAQRLGDIFMSSMKNIKAVSGSTADITEDSELNNLMRELQTKMSNFRKMMQAFEAQLYKKYDAMESSLALLGAQLNYVTGAFSQ